MTFLQFSFYFFSLILVSASVMVITIKNPVQAALFLVLAFFSAAAVWMTLEAEFLAIVLVLVYVGAVMVLFLFVVMMLDINVERLRAGFMQNLPVGAIVASLLIIEMIVVLSAPEFSSDAMPRPEGAAASVSNTKALGLVLYTDYIYPFEIAAIILLVAIIAAISLTLRDRPQTKYQDPATQMAVQRDDRLRIVKMNSESKVSTASGNSDKTPDEASS
ncbi:MAG: NADH-quinone oxidoreductase subunit J [Arenicellales bacterium WSBS_2016_MAG_OTU3]